jgi:hypothetical protein
MSVEEIKELATKGTVSMKNKDLSTIDHLRELSRQQYLTKREEKELEEKKKLKELQKQIDDERKIQEMRELAGNIILF